MPIRIICIEREYGSGGGLIAKRLAQRLGWKLWDEELSAEIARVAQVAPEEVKRRDECVADSFLRRLFAVYARGSYERQLPVSSEHLPRVDWMISALGKVVEDAAQTGNCIIVGRGSPYFLRSREDALRVFIYAALEEKVRRIRSLGKSEKEARQLIEEIDAERSDFIRHYFHAEWPYRPLYDFMLNSIYGDEFVVETILRHMAALDSRASHSAPASA